MSGRTVFLCFKCKYTLAQIKPHPTATDGRQILKPGPSVPVTFHEPAAIALGCPRCAMVNLFTWVRWRGERRAPDTLNETNSESSREPAAIGT